jgi:hypothetical protein
MTVLCVIGLLSWAPSAWAQGNANKFGSFVGSVKSADGKPMANFTFKLVNEEPIGRNTKNKPKTGTIATITTDAQGNFSMPKVPVGAFLITAGNKDIGWLYENVYIEENKETRKDMQLSKGE